MYGLGNSRPMFFQKKAKILDLRARITVHLFCQQETSLIDKKDAGLLDRTFLRSKAVFGRKTTTYIRKRFQLRFAQKYRVNRDAFSKL